MEKKISETYEMRTIFNLPPEDKESMREAFLAAIDSDFGKEDHRDILSKMQKAKKPKGEKVYSLMEIALPHGKPIGKKKGECTLNDRGVLLTVKYYVIERLYFDWVKVYVWLRDEFLGVIMWINGPKVIWRPAWVTAKRIPVGKEASTGKIHTTSDPRSKKLLSKVFDAVDALVEKDAGEDCNWNPPKIILDQDDHLLSIE